MDKNQEQFGLASILKDLEEAVANASRMPLSTKVLVDGDTILNCVDRIYAALPDELKQAQKVLEHSDKLLESVEGQSKRIILEAREQAEQLTQETEIYRVATEQAQELLNKAESASIQLRHESIVYCDDVLQQLEDNIEKMLLSIRKNREDLRGFKYFELDEAE
ncbi:MAG: hypothetical protein IJP07_07360 [Firmicutes bacterium]|nr:hypothetical protein [Bacillota bacterium]